MELTLQYLIYLYFICSTIFCTCIALFSAKKYFCRKVKSVKIIAFFHPYCNNGGGGERVLWIMISSILKNIDLHDKTKIVVYTGDINKSKDQILENVKNHFQIDFTSNDCLRIKFIYIRSRFLLEAKYYRVCTMLFQSIASIFVGLECLYRTIPDIYIDTTGFPFINPFVYLISFGYSYVISYVHYPVISSEMLQVVHEQRPSFNNNNIITTNKKLSKLKLYYYQIFAQCYAYVGNFSSLVFVNSSWTGNHIKQLWSLKESMTNIQMNIDNQSKDQRKLVKLFPPCNTRDLRLLPLIPESVGESGESFKGRKDLILSVGQFRPEKDHSLQIRSFAAFRALPGSEKYAHVRLVLLGSVRHAEDEALMQRLKDLAKELQVDQYVDFVINASYSILLKYLSLCYVGLHTMWNEHFGISVVEMMAAGVITIAHCSGGPLLDIVTDYNGRPTGYLATTAEEYAGRLRDVFDKKGSEELKNLQNNARQSILRFSDELFSGRFIRELLLVFSEGGN